MRRTLLSGRADSPEEFHNYNRPPPHAPRPPPFTSKLQLLVYFSRVLKPPISDVNESASGNENCPEHYSPYRVNSDTRILCALCERPAGASRRLRSEGEGVRGRGAGPGLDAKRLSRRRRASYTWTLYVARSESSIHSTLDTGHSRDYPGPPVRVTQLVSALGVMKNEARYANFVKEQRGH
ncbi:hypothetical protein KGM_204770 [Danaus plexippus plexippus]|uniref:Uncharacterized protein n=1 Tax=Danaus plexippus plexippus TaxID=278856 RepID=A0A212FEB9_DANPL|nr:hypothetical protein KGM_204770 [Danaus plexippus plexippus]